MIDFTYSFFAPTGRAKCRVRIFPNEGEPVVVVTELPDNPGMSVTNAIELIATGLTNIHGFPPDRTTWVEHYPEREVAERLLAEETFDIVTFRWERDRQGRWRASNPRWQRITREGVERLAGERL